MQKGVSVLISTMYQTNTDFLYRMFPYHDINTLNLVIINQTSKDKPLETDLENIKVINSYESGLSKSRNLAIENCETSHAVLADDDLVYQNDFLEKINSAYQSYPEATLISFKLQKYENQFYKEYPDENRQLKLRGNAFMLSSAEISINIGKVKAGGLQFCEYFGLGATFTSCEETLFMRSLLKRKLEAYFVDEPIAIHESEGTGSDPLGNNFIYALAACQFFMYGYGSFIWLIYYLYQMKSVENTSGGRLKTAFKHGLQGIYKANQLREAIVKQL